MNTANCNNCQFKEPNDWYCTVWRPESEDGTLYLGLRKTKNKDGNCKDYLPIPEHIKKYFESKRGVK